VDLLASTSRPFDAPPVTRSTCTVRSRPTESVEFSAAAGTSWAHSYLRTAVTAPTLRFQGVLGGVGSYYSLGLETAKGDLVAAVDTNPECPRLGVLVPVGRQVSLGAELRDFLIRPAVGLRTGYGDIFVTMGIPGGAAITAKALASSFAARAEWTSDRVEYAAEVDTTVRGVAMRLTGSRQGVGYEVNHGSLWVMVALTDFATTAVRVAVSGWSLTVGLKWDWHLNRKGFVLQLGRT
jgi:hypothetical protein